MFLKCRYLSFLQMYVYCHYMGLCIFDALCNRSGSHAKSKREALKIVLLRGPDIQMSFNRNVSLVQNYLFRTYLVVFEVNLKPQSIHLSLSGDCRYYYFTFGGRK